MHSYRPQWPDDRTTWTPPNPADFTYRDALDVERFAALDALTTWYTYPHVWHLDRDGRWHCCSKGSSLDSVRCFAEAPEHMLDCRLTDLDQTCPDFWVVLEPRHEWIGERYEVTEGDAAAFVALRAGLARFGVHLLDVVVFHEDYSWWSLHELTSGTTAWTFEPIGLSRG